MPPVYNERSWTIEVISHLNDVLRTKRRIIRRAGGEQGVSSDSGSQTLFPDVLLFGSPDSGQVLQGWELKMPDTRITDPDLLENAEKKARMLGLNSFLVWNVSEAVLYVVDGDRFTPKKVWAPLPGITRQEVESKRNEWVAFLDELVDALNDFLEDGTIRPQTAPNIFSLYAFADIVLSNTEAVAQALREHAIRDGRFEAEVRVWWATSRAEFPDESDPWRALAKANIIHWLNKLVFAHYLKRFRSEARIVDRITSTASPAAAGELFLELSRTCDFAHVFAAPLGSGLIDAITWMQLQQVNGFLQELRLEAVDQTVLQELLETVIYSSTRKLVGQFATHPRLAQLLVRQTMLDNMGAVLDPFCGTGTIAKAAVIQKVQAGLSMHEALATVWASDKYALPTQLATIALSDASAISHIVHVFQHDALNLVVGETINFRHPDTGELVRKQLPLFSTIVSNLPFVQFEDVKIANPNVREINERLSQEVGMKIPAKADLYAYLPFYLWHLLEPHGRLGVIMSNSWLGTEWGRVFRQILSKYYHLECVTVSQQGRWFENADVVTTAVVLTKRAAPANPQTCETTKFVYTRSRIQDLDDESVTEFAARSLTGTESPLIRIRTRTREEIHSFERFGLPWSALFADLSWFGNISDHLVPITNFFAVQRGARRGWDPLFYPSELDVEHIEPEFLQPVLKSPRTIEGLLASPDGQAFCCSLSIEELEKREAHGALAWIRRFENATNNTGKPLPEVLRLPGLHWYEMGTSTTADLVILINYDQRLFVPKLVERSFVNQRLIALVKAPGVDVELCHALLNSVLGLFYIEALGFGRGLGALDLNSRKIQQGMWMLNPHSPSPEAGARIRKAFAPLLERPVKSVELELQCPQRRAFDEAVLAAYGLHDYLDSIRSSLIELYRIRRAARSQ